jgi:hypothetical protein
MMIMMMIMMMMMIIIIIIIITIIIRPQLGLDRPVWASMIVSSKVLQVVFAHSVCNSARGSEVNLVTSTTQTPSSPARPATSSN